eukprot:4828983-Pyramimonas_sp.AAC.1
MVCYGFCSAGFSVHLDSSQPASGGLRSVKLSPLSRPAGGPTKVGTHGGLKLDLAIPGGCDLRNCRHFRGLLGGPAQW